MIGIILLILFLAIYLYGTRNHRYWAKRAVMHDRPIPIFGNHFRNVAGLRSIGEISSELYNKYPKEKVVGYYRGNTPELLIRDLDIAKTILNVDFTYFYMRGLGRNTKMEPLMMNLFHAEGDTWKLLRQRLTPAFTTAKLRAMFPLIIKCAKKLQTVGATIAASGEECDVRELMARFTTEFIGACGFGIEVDTINNENSMFRKLGKAILTPTSKNFLLYRFYELFPELGSLINASNKPVENGFIEIIRSICEQRNYKHSGRHDFVDLLLELNEKGLIKGDSIETRNPDGSPVQVEMTMDFKCMVAQVFIFLIAGFETSSSATSFMLHQLAFHQDIQKRIQHEIDDVYLKYDKELCYDSIAEMSLLSMAFKESMRLFHASGCLHRVCTKKYTFQELGITIDPGIKIIIPIQAIQMDENIFDNPREFRPEKFAGSTTNRHTHSYLPFGIGPRACIGARLGEMQSLAGLAALLRHFSVEPAPSTRRHLEFNHTSNLVQAVKGGIPLKLVARKKDL